MIRVFPDLAGAYYCRDGVIEYVYFFGGSGTPVERIARMLDVTTTGIELVKNYQDLKPRSKTKGVRSG